MRLALLLLLLAGCAPSATSPSTDSSNLPRVMPNAPTRPKAEAGVIFVSDSSFDRRVLLAPGPTVVDFYADWCGPCRSMEPILASIAKDCRVAKVNADHCPELIKRYRVQGLPTLVIFDRGEAIWRHVGVASEATIRTAIPQH